MYSYNILYLLILIPVETACTQVQDDYDQRRANGTLGSMETRQTCDDDGFFTSYKCIPGQTYLFFINLLIKTHMCLKIFNI